MSTSEMLDLLGDPPDGVRTVVWDGSGEPAAAVADVEFYLPQYTVGPPDPGILTAMPRLRVIQLMSAGVGPWLSIVPDNVVLCSGRGVHGGSTAELAVAGLLSLVRELPRMYAGQAAHEWIRTRTDGLAGKRALIVGAGDIGRRVATALDVFDVSTTFVARTARDGVHALAELPALIGRHDVLVLAVPDTPQTHRLVDAALLSALPDGAIVVNIARGTILDTDALLVELNAGRLKAFLDVTDPEPLPADHPLWDAPNVLITPHIGGGTTGWQGRAAALVRAQLHRYLAGEPLANIVADGY
ncbi:MAG: 2-hydroxyacid dehydrogenase [Jatrophihabitantaceae bacterium]